MDSRKRTLISSASRYNEGMAITRATTYAERKTRSIAASLKMEGQTLSAEQLQVVTEVIEGKRDAGQEIRAFMTELTARVQQRR